MSVETLDIEVEGTGETRGFGMPSTGRTNLQKFCGVTVFQYWEVKKFRVGQNI